MQVILTQDVPKLGKMGEIVKVKDGFARNLLIPKKMAFLATPSNLKRMEQQDKKRKQVFEQERKVASDLAEKLNLSNL